MGHLPLTVFDFSNVLFILHPFYFKEIMSIYFYFIIVPTRFASTSTTLLQSVLQPLISYSLVPLSEHSNPTAREV
jgi:hypothetical protein